MKSNTVEVEKVDNGYIIRQPFYMRTEQYVFRTFEEAIDRLRMFFDEDS